MTAHNSLHTGGATGVVQAVDARLSMSALLGGDANTPDVRQGILYAASNPLNVTGTSSTAPWQYSVAAGAAVASKGALDGAHVIVNDAAVLVSTIAPPASNSRYDVVYIVQQDSNATISPDGATAAIISVVNGTAAASPAVPAAPAGAVILAVALVVSTAIAGTSGAGVTITTSGLVPGSGTLWIAPYTANRGAPIPVRTAAEQAAMTPYAGELCDRLDLGVLQRYSGSQWVSLAMQTTNAGRKNALANPFFSINQRGAATYSATGYTMDRWLHTVGAGATSTISTVATTPGAVFGFTQSYCAWNRTVAGTVDSTYEQRIEEVTMFAGQTATLSVVCSTTSGSVDLLPKLVQNFGTGGAPSASVTTTSTTQTATTTVSTLTWTFAVPSIAGKTIGTTANSDYLAMVLTRAFNATNGATGQVNIFAMQLELGSVGTALEVKPIAEELAACQRFYVRFGGTSGNSYMAVGVAISTTNILAVLPLPVRMRTPPTLGLSSNAHFTFLGGSSLTTSAVTLNASTPDTYSTSGAVTGATTGQAYAFYINTSAGWIDFTSEL